MLFPQLPAPSDLNLHPRLMFAELEGHVGTRDAAVWSADLLAGADPHAYAAVLPYFGGRATQGVLDGTWDLYWARTWGARGLLYVWVDDVSEAVVSGLADSHWRPAEMCLRVTAHRDVAQAAPAVLPWLDYKLPRVRAAACRALGVVGDTEHVDAVLGALDDEHVDVRQAAARALRQLARRLDVDLDEAPDV